VFLNHLCEANIVEIGMETVVCRAALGSWWRIGKAAEGRKHKILESVYAEVALGAGQNNTARLTTAVVLRSACFSAS
jgi:hypothetical protein